MDKKFVLETISSILNKFEEGNFRHFESFKEEIDSCVEEYSNFWLLENFEKERKNSVKKFIEEEIIDQIDLQEIENSNILHDVVNLTGLVEDVCHEFMVDFENGPLDNSDHWIWSDTSDIIYDIGDKLDNDD